MLSMLGFALFSPTYYRSPEKIRTATLSGFRFKQTRSICFDRFNLYPQRHFLLKAIGCAVINTEVAAFESC